MPENLENNLEAEIQELSQKIKEKRSLLEAKNGVISEEGEKEEVEEVLREHISDSAPADTVQPVFVPVQTSPAPKPAPAKKGDYLTNIPEDAVAILNGYISSLPEMGIKKTIEKVKKETPFILDAFHDMLVTHLYQEMKERGMI
jgi:hypothetical protein